MQFSSMTTKQFQRFLLTLGMEDLGKLYSVYKKSPAWSHWADLALSTAMDAILYNIEQSNVLDENGACIGESNEMSVVDAMLSFGLPIIDALQEHGMPLFECIYPIPDPEMCKRSLLMHAIEADREDIVEKILELGKTSGMDSGWIDIGDEDGRSPLQMCCTSTYPAHYINYIKVLIDAGADIEPVVADCYFQLTPQKVKLELIKLGLVKEGTHIAKVFLDVEPNSEHIPLLEALVKSGWDINQRLYWKECSWNVGSGTSVLPYALEKRWSYQTIKWLIDHGADTTIVGGQQDCENLLTLACYRYKDACQWRKEDREDAFDILKLLTKDKVHEARVTGKMTYVRTDVHLLHIAAEIGSMELAQYLLEKGADRKVVAVYKPKFLNFEEQTPLDFAIAKGHSDIVKLLAS